MTEIAWMTAQRGPTAAPYFSLARAAWIAYAFTWDDTSGEFHAAERPRGFATYREAVEASRFLARRSPSHISRKPAGRASSERPWRQSRDHAASTARIAPSTVD